LLGIDQAGIGAGERFGTDEGFHRNYECAVEGLRETDGY
jgi:hypothetical protein